MSAFAFTLPLTLSALLLIVSGTVIGLSRFYFVGTKKFSYKTLTPGHSQGPGWYANLNRAYINGIESFAVTAPAMLLHAALNSAHLQLIGTLAWLYLVGRLLYNFIYLSMGYHLFVSFAWLVGFAATIGVWITLLL